MTLSPILTVFVVTLTVLAHFAMAGFIYDKNGEVTHCNGVPLPPIQTVEQARVETEKRLAAIKAEEARQAELAPKTHPSAEAVSPQEIFFTGKPYIEETGQYAFLFRSYDPELGRWTTTDPSGFQDGANNWGYVSNSPLVSLDPDALAKLVAYLYALTGLQSIDGSSGNGSPFIESLVQSHMQKLKDADSKNPNWHYVNDGDRIVFGIITSPSDLANWGNYDRIYLAAHGVFDKSNLFTGNVHMEGTNYSAASISANNLSAFAYCGSGTVTPWNPNGTVRNWEISGNWFWSVEQFFKDPTE